jgi:hypothetical protein
MISFARKFLFVAILFGSTSFIHSQPAFFQVASTPYDRQMERIAPTLTAPAVYSNSALSFALVNEWMIELRGMPYLYSREWRTPSEVEISRAGDCKGKALLLYDRMQLNGATNLRFVIGKRRASDSLTHAWLEWDTRFGTVLLDPTFNWTATMKTPSTQTYVAFYGYEGAYKYRATNLLLTRGGSASRAPSSPAHGAVTRPLRMSSRTFASSPLFDGGLITPNSFSYRSGF